MSKRKSSYQVLLARYEKEKEKNRQLRRELRLISSNPSSYESMLLSARYSLEKGLEDAVYYGECNSKNFVDGPDLFPPYFST